MSEAADAYFFKSLRKDGKLILYLRYQGCIVFLIPHLQQCLDILIAGLQLPIGLTGIL